MTEETQPKKSAFQDRKEQFIKWFNKDVFIKNNISFEQIIKSFVVIIPVHAILYLFWFYGSFNIRYFYYFNPIDFFNVFYTNNLFSLILFVFLGFFAIYIFLASKDFYSLKHKANKFFFLLFLSFFTICFIYWISDISKISAVPMFICVLVSIFTIFSKETRFLYYSLVLGYFIHTLALAKVDALKVKENKSNFTILLNDNSYALKQDTINRKDYFIGKVTDYIFIYSDSIKAVRVIPVSDIKEIQFPLGK